MINKDILNNFYHAVHFMMVGQFNHANDRYLEIAIGNKAWPIGITMHGVHERTGKSRIFCSYILRILIRAH
jgi:pre-mRNA-splicing factor 18